MLDDRLILNKYQEPSYWQKLSDYWNKMSADQQIYIAEFKEILLKNNISLIYEKYNEYDLDFLAQYYYADFKSLGQDHVTFIHLAEDKLHDIDDDKACEAAYWEAYHRINKET